MTTRAQSGSPVNFSHVQATEADRAISTLVLAFAADPHLRWLFPDAQQYLDHFPDVLRSFAGVAFAGDTIWKFEDISAVALWLPPGVAPDTDATVAVFEASVQPRSSATSWSCSNRWTTLTRQTPHWYLAWIGIDPAHQGRGLGSDLLQRCLEIIDSDHLPTFLDTPNPKTVPFYQRHGFDVVGDMAAGACPPVVSMLRPAR